MPAGVPAAPYQAPSGTHWAQALPGAAVAGLLLAASLAVPYTSILLLMLGTGALGAALYGKRSPRPITPGAGARVGMLSALLGWVLMAILMAMETAVGGGHLLAALRESLQQQIAGNSDPRALEVLEKLNSPGGMTVLVTVGMLLFLLVLLVCGAAGGALSGSLFGKDNNPRK